MASWIAADWPAPANITAGTTLRESRVDALPVGGTPCWLSQVHGADIVEANVYAVPPKADGSFSRKPDQVCVVRTADCLPVLLCSDDGKVAAAAHAGWRGMAAGVIEQAVASMGVDPMGVIAWLGPAISKAAFEVGDEVKAAFVSQDAGAANCFDKNARGRWQADLYALARRRLSSAGVARVYGGGFCTFQDDKRFYSYRRDPDCGRMVSFIALGAP